MVHIPDQDEGGVCGNRVDQAVGQRQIHHARFIYQDEICLQRIVGISFEAEIGRVKLQKPVNRFCFLSCGLREPLGSSAGGSPQQNSNACGTVKLGNTSDQCRLTRARPSRNNECPASQGLLQSLFLARGQANTTRLLRFPNCFAGQYPERRYGLGNQFEEPLRNVCLSQIEGPEINRRIPALVHDGARFVLTLPVAT